MSIFCRLFRRHYWGTPHRSTTDNILVQICYECGAERHTQEIHDQVSSERFKQTLASAKQKLRMLEHQPDSVGAPGGASTPIAAQKNRKFSLVK
jgi:hypothetical protein